MKGQRFGWSTTKEKKRNEVVEEKLGGKIEEEASFHRSNITRQWFSTYIRILMEFLSHYSSFFNPIEEFFLSVWRWKTYNLQADLVHVRFSIMAIIYNNNTTLF